jgi:endonuclease/exonuclease/phosphatase family metal-dependent hydrolase
MPVFNVLTLNTHMGFGPFNRRFVLPELRDAIRTVSADVVFLQEVAGEHQLHAARVGAGWPDDPHHEFLADALWPQAAYGRNAIFPHGHQGNALLSKFPIVRQQNRDISIPGHEERGLLHCVLALPGGRELHAICAHLGLLEKHRRRQLALLCELVDDEIPRGAPVVVAGDFNDWRAAGHPLLARCGLKEVFATMHGRLARSFPARLPLLPLDRIYVRNVRVESPRVLSTRPWSHLSDHAPLVATIEA